MAPFQPAPTGRARCRGCGAKIDRGELRFGEELDNPFADDARMTHWYHPRCAAYKRPAALLDGLREHGAEIAQREELESEARRGLDLRRLPRIDGAERASSGRAVCRSCRDTIERNAWRIRLVFFEGGRFEPGGFIHAGCAATYFGTGDVIARVARFTRDLEGDEFADLQRALGESRR